MAFIRIMNEASFESGASFSREKCLDVLHNVQEDWFHPHVANSVTGLNYDTDPNGYTRVGLEYCIHMYSPEDAGDENCSLPRPLDTWRDGDPGPWDLNPLVFSINYDGLNCGADWNHWELIKNLIEARFGPKQWTKDGVTVTNPHPHKIIISVDDSGSMEEDEAWNTVDDLITYYRQYMTADEMRNATDFRRASACTNSQDADGYSLPIGFWYNFETGSLNSGPNLTIRSRYSADSQFQFYYYTSGALGEGFFNVMYPFQRNLYYGI